MVAAATNALQAKTASMASAQAHLATPAVVGTACAAPETALLIAHAPKPSKATVSASTRTGSAATTQQ